MTKVGAELPPLRKGVLTSAHIARWCAAQQNWDRIHYDADYARNVAGLPGTVINGALKQHLVTQFLIEAFDGLGWIWKLNLRFTGADLVGHGLTVEGRIAGAEERDDRTIVTVECGIRNNQTAEITTEAQAEVILGKDGKPLHDALQIRSLPDSSVGQPLDRADDGLPARIRDAIGQQLERMCAQVPLEAGRLQLFADAVMGVRPEYFDVDAGHASRWGEVVAFPLFPVHALVQAPGRLLLSDDPQAMGREGVAEIGRNMAGLFGLPPYGLLNGGCKVVVHSLLRLGEVAEGTSRLLSAKHRAGKRGGSMIFLETLNEYSERSGRPLLTEIQTIVQRIN